MIKHVELNVIRDEHGRVLRTETHEWTEGPDNASKHLQAAQIELGTGRAHLAEVTELKQRLAEIRLEHEREITELKNRHLHTVSTAADLGGALIEDQLAAARKEGYEQGRYEAVTIATKLHEDLMKEEKEEGRA